MSATHTFPVPAAKIPAERLEENKEVVVKGRVAFSHIASQYSGEALDRRIAAQRQRGAMYVTEVPHTVLALVDAEVLPLDPANPTLEEQAVAQKLYTITKGDNAGKNGYQIEDKSKFLPIVFAPSESQPGKYEQVKLTGELANDLTVLVTLRTFKPGGGYAKKGIGLQSIAVTEPLRYYGGGASTESLAARGIVIAGEVSRVSAEDGVADAALEKAEAAANQPLPNTSYDGGYAQPSAPAPQQAQAPQVPTQAPFPAQAPVQQAAPAAPAPAVEAPQAPAPAPQGASAFDAPAASDAEDERKKLQARLAELNGTTDPSQI